MLKELIEPEKKIWFWKTKRRLSLNNVDLDYNRVNEREYIKMIVRCWERLEKEWKRVKGEGRETEQMEEMGYWMRN